MTATPAGLTQPLLLVEHGGDVTPHKGLTDLANAVEGVDLEDGNFSAYDGRGRLIDLEAAGVKRTRLSVAPGTVTATLSEPARHDPAALSQALTEFLTRLDPAAGVEGLGLDELVWRLLLRCDWDASAVVQ